MDKADLTELHNNQKWSLAKHERFMEAVDMYGKDWPRIAKHVGTCNPKQAYEHSRVLRRQIKKNPFHPDAYILPLIEAKDNLKTKKKTNTVVI